MGWICCFGGKRERVRRLPSDGRARRRIKEISSTEANAPDLQSLGAHLKSSQEACSYEELSQPKQGPFGTSHGTKLFKRRSVRRAKSCGNSTAFENGAKKLFDKNAEGRRTGRVDRLQEEVEILRRRLAEEEQEARNLRNEVVYLRSCGVLQSPDRHRNSLNLEKESLLPNDDKGQRHWHSWLGLSLSPTSRFKLEEQLRCMAADELSKVPSKGLTNGQKALIVATKLWQANGAPPQQNNQTKLDLVNSSCTSDGSHCDTSGQKWPPGEEKPAVSDNHDDNETACSDHHQLQSKDPEQPRGEGALPPYANPSGLRKTIEVLKSPLAPTSRAMENFSFHPSASEEKITARHLFPASSPRRDVPVLQRISSCPERTPIRLFGSETEDVTGKYPADPSPEKLKYESPKKSPKRSSSLSGGGTGGHTSDSSEHVHARRFIDLKYQELEEKLLKSPTKEKVSLRPTPENSPPRLSNSAQPGVVKDFEHEISFTSEIQPSLDSSASSITGDVTSPSAQVMMPYFESKSGRLWQPLSPVQEVDSRQTSTEDLDRTSMSQPHVSDSIDSSLTSDLKSPSVGTVLSGSEWEQHEAVPQDSDDMSEVPDDDLFTLSPRRLHSYNAWDAVHRPDEDVEDVDSRSVTDWASSEETDLDDFAPIQCQSPAFSPKQTSSRSRFDNEKVLKVEEYARDKYFKDIGLNVEEFLSSADSCLSNKSVGPVQGRHEDGTEILQASNLHADSPGASKENKDGMEIPVNSSGHVITAIRPLREVSSVPKKALLSPTDMALSHSQDFDHPVLASVENLPKWIEFQGVPTGSIDNTEGQHQEIHQDARSDRSTLSCDCNSVGEGHHQQDEEQSQVIGLVKVPELRREDDLPTLEFSVRHNETSHQAYDDLDEEMRLRLSLHGFVYPDEHVLNLSHSRSLSMGNLVEEQSEDLHQNDTDIMIGELSHPEKQTLGSFSTQFGRGVNGTACPAEVVDKQNSDLLDRLTSYSSASMEQNAQQQVDAQKTIILDNDMRHDVLSHVQSLRYSIQIPKLTRDSLSCTERGFEYPCVGGDSEASTATSRDDESFHDCESPTPSDSNPEPAHCNSFRQAETNSVPRSERTSRLSNEWEELPAARRLMDISPDDRPILGTVATHWGENNDPKCLREWDGLGIPNSTSKFKEDQRVNWHTTPFETRLEQALAKLPTVPELCNQRNLFEEVAMM